MSEESRGKKSALPWLLFAASLAGLVAVAWFAWQQRQEESSSKDALTNALVEATNARKGTEDKLADALAQVQRLTDENQELQGRASELTATLEQREEELKRLTATSRTLEEKLAAEIKRGDIKVTQAGDRIQVDLIDKVLFDSGQADVSTRGQEVLTRLGAILKDIDDRQVQISGHTDDSPITLPDLKAKFDSNWELSASRAVNVVRFLAENAGVKPQRLSAAGYGQYRPVAGNITPKGRAANRRIEVLLLPPIQARKATLPAK